MGYLRSSPEGNEAYAADPSGTGFYYLWVNGTVQIPVSMHAKWGKVKEVYGTHIRDTTKGMRSIPKVVKSYHGTWEWAGTRAVSLMRGRVVPPDSRT